MNARQRTAIAVVAMAASACGHGAASSQAAANAAALADACAHVQNLSDAWTLSHRIKPVVDEYTRQSNEWLQSLDPQRTGSPMPSAQPEPKEKAQADTLAKDFAGEPRTIADAANRTTDVELQRIALDLRAANTAPTVTALAARCTALGRTVRPPA